MEPTVARGENLHSTIIVGVADWKVEFREHDGRRAPPAKASQGESESGRGECRPNGQVDSAGGGCRSSGRQEAVVPGTAPATAPTELGQDPGAAVAAGQQLPLPVELPPTNCTSCEAGAVQPAKGRRTRANKQTRVSTTRFDMNFTLELGKQVLRVDHTRAARHPLFPCDRGGSLVFDGLHRKLRAFHHKQRPYTSQGSEFA